MAKFRISKDGKNYTVTAPDEASALSALGVGAPATPAAPEHSMFPRAKELAMGAVKGVVGGTLDLPFTVAHIANEGISQLTGKPIPSRAPSASPVSNAIERAVPTDPDYASYRTAAQVVAPVLTGSALAGGWSNVLNAPNNLVRGLNVAGNVARDAASTAGAIGGGMAGGAIGESVGGDFGRDFGALLGGGAGASAPGVAARKANNYFVNQLTDSKSARRLGAVDAINDYAKTNNRDEMVIPPSLGLVGSKTAGVWEDSQAGVAGASPYAAETRRAQFSGMDQTAKEVADMLRGGPATGEISQGSIGSTVADTARTANTAFRDRISARQGALESAIGPDTPVDVWPVLDTIKGWTDDPTVGRDLKGAPAARGSVLNSDRNTPIDPALAASLDARTRLAQKLAASPILSAIPSAASSLNRILAALEQARDRNTGVTYGALKDWRTVNGQSIEGMPPISTQMADKLYGVTTDAMRDTATARGLGGEFNAANAEAARLHQGALDPYGTGQRVSAAAPIPVTDRISSQAEGPAYNSVFSSTNAQSPSILDILSEGAPNATRGLLADNFELKTRGLGAGIQGPMPESMKPKKASDWLASLPTDTLERYAGAERQNPADYSSPMTGADPQISNLITSLTDVLLADARRPTRTLPGQGGNTLGAPGMFYSGVGGVGGATTGALLGGPLGAILGQAVGGAAPGIKASLVGKLMTDPGVTRAIVNARGRMPGAFDPRGVIPAFAGGAIAAQPAPVEPR